MHQTGFIQIASASQSAPFHLMDPTEPEEDAHLGSAEGGPAQHSPDKEMFIRRAFEQDACQGCELLFRQYYDALCSHAVRFVASRAVAEDIVADIFYQFYAERVFQGITTSYRAYLYKSVRHRAFNYVRDTLRRESSLDEARYQGVTQAQQPDAITHYEELYQDVERAIQTLPLQRRRIYLMHRFEGRKQADIAQELGLSVRTVEVQVRQASHHMRELLRKKWLLLVLYGLVRFL